MDKREAVMKLLKIANKLEEEAQENTFFVCLDCSHTASLKDINGKRKVAAEQLGVDAPMVTVNDIVKCIACGGKMLYVPTEDSQKYYIEASVDEQNEAEEDKGEDKEKDKGEDKEDPIIEKGKDLLRDTEKGVLEEEVVKKEDSEKDMHKDVKVPKREPPKFEKIDDEKEACLNDRYTIGVLKYKSYIDSISNTDN